MYLLRLRDGLVTATSVPRQPQAIAGPMISDRPAWHGFGERVSWQITNWKPRKPAPDSQGLEQVGCLAAR